MATPRAAEHRDLEQRFRNIERQIRDLHSIATQRPVLTVSELAAPFGVYAAATPEGDVILAPAEGAGVLIGHTTTAEAANCHLDSAGRVSRSTSSRRYKQDEQPASVDTAAVLALQPRVFRSRNEVESMGDDAPTHVGFIAEEADELGLSHWITLDRDGQPEAFAYATWCVALQAVVQAQQAQIDALAERLQQVEDGTPDAVAASTTGASEVTGA